MGRKYGNKESHLEPPWLDDDCPDIMCENCGEFGTNDIEDLEITRRTSDIHGEATHFKCPACGKESPIDW